MADSFQKSLSAKTTDGDAKRRSKDKSSFFKDNNFLDGFEDDLAKLDMNKDDAYNKLDDWATNFNKY